MLRPRDATVGRLARAAARPFELVAQTLRGEGIDDMRRNGEQRLLRSALASLGPAPVLFDVGANVGTWTSWAASVAPGATIHCFEPHPVTHAELERATSGLANVHRHRVALGAEPGTATLYTAGDISPLASLHQRELSAFGIDHATTTEVEVLTLDAFCAANGIAEIGFLKADVEGHERDLVEGAADLLARHAIGVVQFEFGGTYLDAGIRLGDVTGLFPEDYALVKLVPWGVMPLTQEDLRVERFHLSNYAAIAPQLR
jgi:FkbM family methyltransferase